MTVHEITETVQASSPSKATIFTGSDIGSPDELAVDPLERATAVAISAEMGVPTPRPPHPGPLVWVDMTDEVCRLGREGRTVRQIATALDLTKTQVEDALDAAGLRRLHAAPVSVGRRTFDRRAVLAARRQGVSIAELAQRYGVSKPSIRLAIKEGGGR